jgi:hypothetical protein
MNEPKDTEPCYPLSVVQEAFYDCSPVDDWDKFVHVLGVRNAQYLNRREEQIRIGLRRSEEERERFERQID